MDDIKVIDNDTVEFNGDLRMSRPVKNKKPKPYYGCQECATLESGRWEGFVSLIETEAGFNNAMWIFDKYVNGLTKFADYIKTAMKK